jgi:hypothetical protein
VIYFDPCFSVFNKDFAMSDRVWRGEEFWRAAIEAQPKSGLSVAAYCRQHKLPPNSFYTWRSKFASRQRPPAVRSAAATAQAAVNAQAKASSVDADRQRLIEVIVDRSKRRDTDGQALPSPSPQLIEVSLPGGVCLRLHGDVSAAAVSQLAQALGLRSQTDSGYPQRGETS